MPRNQFIFIANHFQEKNVLPFKATHHFLPFCYHMHCFRLDSGNYYHRLRDLNPFFLQLGTRHHILTRRQL